MGKSAIIVESPAKTRTLERFVGPDFVVLASMGHVRDLPQRDLGVDVEGDFEPQYEVIPRAEKIISDLKKKLKGVETVYLASDPDREGEAIGWHLAQILKVPDTRRIRFNEITESAVKASLEDATEINMRLVDAQQARRVLDRLVGYMISPVLWKRIRTGSRGGLSAGRVQSVALRMIVDREREIGAFIPDEYWSVEAQLTPADRDAQFTAELTTRDGEKLGITTQEDAETAVAELRDAEYSITGIEKKQRRSNPQPPFITSTLQQQASGKLRFSARKTMMVAQQIYEGIELPEGQTALITYMRTDSTRIADSARNEAVDLIKSKFGDEYVGKGAKRKKKAGQQVQDAHEAIRPTHPELDPESIKSHLSDEQFRLYELIWQRFLASQMSAAVFDVTSVQIAAGRHGLRASGSVPVFAGYRAVYEDTSIDESKEKKEDRELPELHEDEALRLLDLLPEQHFTKPPPRYTEASLVRALEENGIGRPSTYAAIIETLRQKNYATMEKRAFVPTRLGITLCDYLLEYFSTVMDVNFTANVEADLDRVEAGEQDWVELIRELHGPLTQWIDEAENSPPKELDEKCPECGGILHEKYSATGRFAGCEKYPECKYTHDIDLGVPQPETPDLEGEECPECSKGLVIKQGPTGAFVGCEGYPDCRYTRPIDADPDAENAKPKAIDTEIECDECAKPLIIRHGRRGPFLGCSGYPKCKSTRNLTKEEAEQYGVELTEPADEDIEKPDVKCPECGEEMVIRRGRRGPFLGCSKYPKCRGTAQMDGTAGKASRPQPEPTGENCPDCGKPLLMRSGRRGPFVGCSGYPKCRFVQDAGEA
ncbi:MAG TPA: type I DNA topoisomerase [Armatimonadota bacterium]|nr:type I DNA topoisomerase [Armatimonadota bacterium]